MSLNRNITLLGITAEIPEHPHIGQDKDTKNWFITNDFQPILYVGEKHTPPTQIAIFAAFCAAEWARTHEEKGCSFEFEWKGIYQEAMKMIKSSSKSNEAKVRCVAQRAPNCNACQCSKFHSTSKCKSKDWSWHTCLVGGTVKCLPDNHPERTEYEETKTKVLAERAKDRRPKSDLPEDGKLGCPC